MAPWVALSAGFAVCGTIGAPSGCLQPRAATTERVPRVSTVDYYNRALSAFDQAIFHKPRESPPDGIETDLAPLLIHQVGSTNSGFGRSAGFGAVQIDELGVVQVDTGRPTIYTASRSVPISGIEHHQVIYVWWYGVDRIDQDTAARLREADEGFPTANTIEARGVRITLDADGFPCVWETLSGDQELDLLFVSESLERAAAAAFGRPLPGRRYSIERNVGEAPRTVVARLIDDGPIPMGPVVYVCAAGRRVITVTCRCSPSQMDTVVRSAYYDLQPLDSLRAWGLDLAALGGFDGPPGENEPPATSSETGSPKRPSLERRLRWPIGVTPEDPLFPG